MCGIVGLVPATRAAQIDILSEYATKMRDAMVSRGPDDAGLWVDEKGQIALGQRRLSIIDLSPAGHQPMHSRSGRYTIVFNGEIYNFQSLRTQLAARGYKFKGTSDTEVLLAGIEHWGLTLALSKANGMFALALWDNADKKIYLARDRIGKKPLYFGWLGEMGRSDFAFASELKAFKQNPEFEKRLSREAINLYFQQGHVPAPYSIYDGIFKLPAGMIFSCYVDHLQMPRSLEDVEKLMHGYWSLKSTVSYGQQHRFSGPAGAVVEMLEEKLLEAVRLRMIADVPLGAFLSGGIDSSTVVALMQAQSTQPVKTFSIGFSEDEYNEATYAKQVAEHLKTDHHEFYVSTKDAQDVIPKLAGMYDEPFADESAIPTYLVAKLAREHVTVCLTGDGGDEFFAGYNRYQQGRKLQQIVDWCPKQLRMMLAWLITGRTASLLKIFPQIRRQPQLMHKLQKVARVLQISDSTSIYSYLVAKWPDLKSLLEVTANGMYLLATPQVWPEFRHFEHLLMYLDAMTYLPDHVLTKVDRASMAVSMEVRNPLLDVNIMEFAWQLPLQHKLRNGITKWPLRKVLEKYVPQELIDRPKMGFGVPVGEWLKGDLKEWGEDLIQYKRLKDQGHLKNETVQSVWQQHQKGQRNNQDQLWTLLMFQAWLAS